MGFFSDAFTENILTLFSFVILHFQFLFCRKTGCLNGDALNLYSEERKQMIKVLIGSETNHCGFVLSSMSEWHQSLEAFLQNSISQSFYGSMSKSSETKRKKKKSF